VRGLEWGGALGFHPISWSCLWIDAYGGKVSLLFQSFSFPSSLLSFLPRPATSILCSNYYKENSFSIIQKRNKGRLETAPHSQPRPNETKRLHCTADFPPTRLHGLITTHTDSLSQCTFPLTFPSSRSLTFQPGGKWNGGSGKGVTKRSLSQLRKGQWPNSSKLLVTKTSIKDSPLYRKHHHLSLSLSLLTLSL